MDNSMANMHVAYVGTSQGNKNGFITVNGF
jgi:hypothetical protein